MDAEPLVQTELELSHIYSKLLGCNEAAHVRFRSEQWITDAQKRCFDLGVQMVHLFEINVTAKVHRFMRHLHFHLT